MKRSLGVDIAIHLKIMFWVCLWVPSNTYIAKLLYGSFVLFTVVFVMSLLLAQLLYLVIEHFDLILFVNSLTTLTSNIKILLIMTRFRFMKEELQDLIKNFNALRSNRKSVSESENKILETAEKESRVLTNGLLSGFITLFILMVAKPLFVQYTSTHHSNSTDLCPERSFIMLSWYPWGTCSTTIYAAIYVSQIYALFMIIMQIAVYQTLNTSILIHIAAEVDIIYDKFISVLNQNNRKISEERNNKFPNLDIDTNRSKNNEKLKQCYALNKDIVCAETNSTALKNNHIEGIVGILDNVSVAYECVKDPISNMFSNDYDKSEEEGEQEEEEEVYNRLIEIVKHHQSVFRFSEEVNNMFSPFYLFQFSTVIIGLCFASFLASMPSLDSETRMQFIIFTFLLMAQLLLPCWYGQRVTDQSERIRDAVYGCRWYDKSPRFKKAVQIIIMRCQRPICFSVGGFAVISRETWLSLINFTYSLLAVLRQMDEDTLQEN
ncbi:Odorant receptor 112 [Blattella germanica]|nr:Odorant receptor 112 [Blattella germanica]